VQTPLSTGLWQLGWGKYNLPRATKICSEKVCRRKFFGKIWAKYPFHPKKLPDPTTMELKD